MKKGTIIRIICDICIFCFVLGFILSLLWYINGSLELLPTQEQEEKAKIAAFFFMAVFGISSVVSITVRGKHRKT